MDEFVPVSKTATPDERQAGYRVTRMLSRTKNYRHPEWCVQIVVSYSPTSVILSTTSHACWHLPNHYDCHAEQGRMAASKHLNVGRHHASRIGDWVDRDAQ